MALRAVTSIFVGLTLLSACGGRDDASQGRDQSRLDAMERRLDAIDQQLAATQKDLAAGARLRDDVHALEQRLGTAEAKVSEALETAKHPPVPAAATGAGAAAAPFPATIDPAERREQLSALMTEYRRRLSSLAAQQGPQVDPAARMMARRSLRDWYIAHRRAILAGHPLPDWHPETP